MKPIRFTSHAEAKFVILAEHGCVVSKARVLEVVRGPDFVFKGFRGWQIAQGLLDEDHVLRVVFEERGEAITVVTFCPGRRARYEGSV